MIVLLHAGEPDLLDRLHAVRAAGDVPLVGDDRWPRAQTDAVRATAAAATPPEGTGWAALTSGSSGAPRIVLRTDASWADSFDTVSDLLGVRPGETIALPAPASSSLTLFSLAHALAGGPRPSSAPAEASVLHGTPQSLRRLLEDGVPAGLRTALVGGSHLDPALRERATAAGIRVVSYYGAAELSFVAADIGDGLRPFPGVEVDIRDGVLWVRSPFVASGYAGTAGPLRQDGEWATVGDRAEWDGERVRLLGREDDAILSASATIVPDEVEAVLRSVPGVRDAVVFGMPQGRVGALVAAVIEPEGRPVPLARLQQTARERLAPAHRPRRWFAGELPRTVSGKPARAETARRALAGEVAQLVP